MPGPAFRGAPRRQGAATGKETAFMNSSAEPTAPVGTTGPLFRYCFYCFQQLNHSRVGPLVPTRSPVAQVVKPAEPRVESSRLFFLEGHSLDRALNF